jgi:hypothetical protein
MKKFFLILISFVLVLSGSYAGFVKRKTTALCAFAEPVNTDVPQTSYKDSVIAILLNSFIEKAINDYYGEPTQYSLYEATVKETNRINTDFAFKITISVPTFHGAHNPPYGLETMTFSVIPGQIVKLENYKHTDA